MKTTDRIDTVDFQKDKATYLSETIHEVENVGSTTIDLIVVD
jgi:hypothetical protein